MVMKRIQAMLQSCATDSPPFPPTILYNESWLLRLVLDWFATHYVPKHPLAFPEKAQWFSEALLPSTFLAQHTRHTRDPLAESRTHADGTIGHFIIGHVGKADLWLQSRAKHLVVLEAKFFSRLSAGITNARYFDQAARTVACIAEILRRADRHPSNLSHLGFYVLAPWSQIVEGVFAKSMNHDSMRRKVEQRVKEYGGVKDEWYTDWFEPTLRHIEVGTMSWEDLIETISEHDLSSAVSIEEFYQQCVKFGSQSSKART